MLKAKTHEPENFVNGVDVDAVLDLVNRIEVDPGQGRYEFQLHNTWIDGGHNHGTVNSFLAAGERIAHRKRFDWDADEPPALAGRDIGANPVEHLLYALSACLTSAIVYHSAARDIHIERLECQLKGDIDLRGFLGISKDVRPGYKNIQVNFKIETPEKDLEKFKELSMLSPVLDTTLHGTNIDLNIERIIRPL